MIINAPARTKTIRRLEVASEGLALTDLLAAFPEKERFLFQSPAEGFGFAGVGVQAEIQTKGTKRFKQVSQDSRELFEMLEEGSNPPFLFGGFSFSERNDPDSEWAGFGTARFVLPEILLVRQDSKIKLIVHKTDDKEISTENLIELIREKSTSIDHSSSSVRMEYPESKTEWEAKVLEAQQRLSMDGLQKVVLSRAANVESNADLNLLKALATLQEEYPACFQFLIEVKDKKQFMGATPERLVAVCNGEVRTMALAGSTGRGNNLIEDERLAQELLNCVKDNHEHALVVNDILARLGNLTDTLDHSVQPEIIQLANIQHLETRIAGKLKAGTDILDVVAELHPTPAVGGTPREAAMKVIADLEEHERGWYAAPLGWFDNDGNGEFVVGLRSALVDGKTARLYGGAGIVRDSVPENEWAETEKKLRPMWNALGGSQ